MRGGALGDFVLGLPALEALRESYPHAHLHLLAPGAVMELASPMVDAATPLERADVAWFFAEPGDTSRVTGDQYRDLDLVVLWLAGGSGAVRDNFQRLGARRILHAPAIPPTPGLHAADHLLQTLQPLGIRLHFPAIPVVAPEPSAVEEAAELLLGLGVVRDRPAVAIHPGSGGDWKRWPAERFAKVAHALRAAGLQVVLIQGPADEIAMGQLLARLPGERLAVISGLGIRQLGALLTLFSCYLGNDSGVTHLAAAASAPVVALFGPTDPAVWGPRGPRMTVLRAGDEVEENIERLAVEPVLSAVMSMLRPKS